MHRFRSLFPGNRCNVIGMVHVGGLPGTAAYQGSVNAIIDDALREASIYKDYGLDGILVENMHDTPYVRPKDLTPETVSIMTRVCTEIRKVVPSTTPCGVQILAGCNKEAIAVAKAADFQFIRAEGYVFSHVADEGFTDACAGPLIRYRKQIDAEDVLIFADVKKKHSAHAITCDVGLTETIRAAEFFRADGVILTGTATGEPVHQEDLPETLDCHGLPVLIGSGITAENFAGFSKAVHAVIVGSYFKEKGDWRYGVCEERVKAFMLERTKDVSRAG